MRFPLLVWPTTSLFLAGLSSAAATVYLRPSGTQVGLISPTEADVLLAHHLGLESTASLDDGTLQSLLESAGGQTALGRELLDSADDSLLLVVDASSADVQRLIPDSWNSPSFTSSIASSSLESLLSAYSATASRSDFTVYSNPDMSSTGAFPHHRLLDMFDFAGDSQAAESFVKSFDALVEFVERTDFSTRRFGAFHLSGLPELGQQYGHDSDAYSAMMLAVKSALSNPSLERANVAVIFSSPGDQTRRDFAAAAKSTQVPFPLPPGNAPIFSSSTCYASAATCRNGTTECSGRGQCSSIKKGMRECFVCQCALTKDAKNRTEYWSGASCQNKDVSTAFTLIAGTSIAIVLIIAFSISLLYSIGTQELPNVLTGGIVHAKRD